MSSLLNYIPSFPRLSFSSPETRAFYDVRCPHISLRPRNSRSFPLIMHMSPVSNSNHEHTTQQTFFATCARGLGPLLSKEVSSPLIGGIIESVAGSGVEFRGGWDVGYRACLWLRTAMRMLVLLGECDIQEGDDIYESVYDMGVNWGEVVGRGCTFAVEARFSRDAYGGRMGQWIQRRVKDAVCDWLKDHLGLMPKRPESYAMADLGLFVTFYEGRLVVYRDMAGASLHKRGYRGTARVHRSVLNETVAAGMLFWAGFDVDGSYGEGEGTGRKELTIVDPMCGSGTVLMEAALLRLRVAPGLYRRNWPFEQWSDFNPDIWEKALEEATVLQRRDSEIATRFLGNDWHAGALDLADITIRSERLDPFVKLTNEDVGSWRPHLLSSCSPENTLVLSNPPWGGRIDDEEEAWHNLGQFLREETPGCSVYLLSGNKHVTRRLRMKASKKIPIRIGNTDCRLLEYKVLPQKRDVVQGEGPFQVTKAMSPTAVP